MPLTVIGGLARGRRLKSPPGEVRPTAAILRRALFDILGPRVVGARVLDLYAGSGALGIEALSRGAAACDFVERDRRACAVARANLAAIADVTGETSGRVHCASVQNWLGRRKEALGEYDLVLLDPPYGDASLGGALALVGGAVLRPGALVVVEERAGHPVAAPAGLREVRVVRHGDSALTMLAPA